MQPTPVSTHHIDYLLRRFDPAPLPDTAPSTLAPPECRRAWHVRGIGRLLRDPAPGDAAGDTGAGTDSRGGGSPATGTPTAAYLMRDALIGIYGYKIPIALLIQADAAGVVIQIGVWSAPAQERPSARRLDARADILASVLSSLYPGIDLVAAAPTTPTFPLSGLVLGQPSRKPMVAPDTTCPLDRIVRAMAPQRWAALVLAEPVDESVVSDLRNAVLNEQRAIQADAQIQAASGPLAQLYGQLLDAHLGDYTFSHAEGAWRTAVYLLGDATSYYRLAAAWRSAFAGEESVAEPVRVVQDAAVATLALQWALPDLDGAPGPGHYRHPFSYQSLLTSSQLAAYLQFPGRETSGFAVRLLPSFDCVPATGEGEDTVALGNVIERDRTTAAQYRVSHLMLTRHCLVTGVTGSGKTNTIFHMLDQLWRARVPFLVLEPAKTEYRALLDHPVIGPDLRVFTAGDETLSPLRLNPFEFEPTTSLSTHIDLLRSVFDVSFGMWPPLPQVLEQCIHTVYADCGWDPTRTVNDRLDDQHPTDPWAFPTLTQLYRQVEETVSRLGYEERVASDIKAALLTRLNSLRVGAKGRMLDTARSVPLEELLRLPTVIELEAIGDDDEKAFVIGLLMARLYEHLRGHGAAAGDRLRHMTIVEEAHRLLPALPVNVNAEQSNMRGKAVETFVSMLSEVRAYGECLTVAEQIPNKLAADVLKSTNLKIVHRIVAEDDRQAVGGTMNMDRDQLAMLSTLKTGRAAVYSEGDDRPILVQVPYAKLPAITATATKALSDERLAARMAPFRHQESLADAFVPHRLCAQSCGRPYAFCEAVRPIVDSPAFREQFACLPLTCVLAPASLPQRLEDWRTTMRSVLPERAMQPGAFQCATLNGCLWYVTTFGRKHHWAFATAHLIYDGLAQLLTGDTGAAGGTRGAFTTPTALASDYRAACRRRQDPFPVCETLCPSGECLFRHHAAMPSQDKPLADAFDRAMAHAGATGLWDDVTPVRDVVRRLHATDLPAEHRRSLSLCYGVQRIAALPGLLQPARTLAMRSLMEAYDRDDTVRQEAQPAHSRAPHRAVAAQTPADPHGSGAVAPQARQ